MGADMTMQDFLDEIVLDNAEKKRYAEKQERALDGEFGYCVIEPNALCIGKPCGLDDMNKDCEQ